MTPQELRASIIQQAIQGKLVEQRPEEGTGADLFQQIPFLRNHFHQLQDGTVGTGFDGFRQGDILCALAQGPEVHQDFICYPPPNAFLMH
mgnify:CR=1 FL=1